MNTSNGRPGAGWVPALVDAGLRRCRREQTRLAGQKPATHADQAVRAERLALLHERDARWWTVLERWTYLGQQEIPTVYGAAAMAAAGEGARRAQFYRDLAQDWHRRAAGLPVCDVIGCGCGGSCEMAA